MKTHPASFLPPGHRVRRAASTLPATMMVVVIISGFLATAATVTSQFGRYAGRQQGVSMEAVYADAALEYAYAQWKSYVGNYMTASAISQVPSGALVSGNVNKSDFQTLFPYASQLGIDTSDTGFQLTIQAVDQNGANSKSLANNGTGNIVPASAPSNDPAGVPPVVLTQNVPGYPGWTGYTYNYVAKVKFKSTHYGMSDEYYEAKRYFQVTKVPLCQAVVFYENNLEIHPGADMYLNGPVHTNGSLWAQAIQPSTTQIKLQFMKNVSYVQNYSDNSSNPDVTYSWADGTTANAGTLDNYRYISPTLYSDGKPLEPFNSINYYGNVYPAMAVSGFAATQINKVNPIDPFGGATTSNNGLRDIIEVPDVKNTSDQIAYNNAALVVTVDSTILGPDKSGTLNTIPATGITIQVRDATSGKLGTALLATDTDYKNVFNAINKGVVSTFTDNRESATAYVTNLDMAQLDTITTMPKDTSKATDLQKAFNKTGTQGGTVYIYDKSTIRTGGTRAAIRLTNGRDLGENVSVASQNGVYIQGDYNTGTGTVPSNASGVTVNTNPAPFPQVSGYSRYAASVMADAVTVLSNNWNDNYTQNSINDSTRKATATTVNAAILSGDVISNGDGTHHPSGGVHNFPRFLENWTGVNFTYYGSLIEAFKSESYTGRWQTGKVYTWPNRLWNFDTNFLNQQPPGMPQGRQFSRGRWERGYNETNATF